jgi:hypothetical protein
LNPTRPEMFLPLEIFNLLINKTVVVVVDNARSPVVSATESLSLRLPLLCPFRTTMSRKLTNKTPSKRNQVQRRASPPFSPSCSRWDASPAAGTDQIMKPASYVMSAAASPVCRSRTAKSDLSSLKPHRGSSLTTTSVQIQSFFKLDKD